MDHAIDESVLRVSSPVLEADQLPIAELQKVLVWLDSFLADDACKLAIDSGYAIWETYQQLGENNFGLRILQAKLDKLRVRDVQAPQSVSGGVTVPAAVRHLDGHRQWLFAIANQRPSEISIANATHEAWHTKPPTRKFEGVQIEQILHDWLHATVTAKQVAENTDRQQAYYIPPDRLDGVLTSAEPVGIGKNGRKAWEDDQRRYEFDRQHNTVEVYALGSGTWLYEARLDGTILKTTGGEGRYWGK